MSLILDALNRSDSDRSSTGDTPGIHSVHGGGAELREPAWRRWLWPGLTLLFAVVALLAWWGSGSEPQAPQAVATEVAPTASAPEPVQQPEQSLNAMPSRAAPQPQRAMPRESTAELPRPAPGFSDDVAALYSQMQAAGVDPDTVDVSESPRRERPAAQPAGQVDAQSLAELQRMAAALDSGRSEPEPEPALAPEPVQQDSYDVDALARAAQAELDNRQRSSDPVVQHEAPFIADLRQSQKDQIPSVFYSQHNWSSDPSKRSVILNGEERREGQQIKPGLRLVEILESSIVLNFNGTEFQLRSLNSWVNL